MSCEQCGQGYVMKGEPEGTLVDGAYLHEGSDKSRAIVLLTDVFGLPLVNCKLMADQFSKKLGCDVWVPDMFNGQPVFTADELEPLVPDKAGDKVSLMSMLRMFILILTHARGLYASRSSVVDERVGSFISKIKAEKKYEKIGTVGYCFGGSVAIRLGSTDLVDVSVVAHPGRCNIQQIQAIKVPTSWICAESDMSFGPALRNQAEAAFAARKDKPDYVDYEFVDFKGTAHGFAARPNFALPEIVEAWNNAFQQTVAWFEKKL